MQFFLVCGFLNKAELHIGNPKFNFFEMIGKVELSSLIFQNLQSLDPNTKLAFELQGKHQYYKESEGKWSLEATNNQ